MTYNQKTMLIHCMHFKKDTEGEYSKGKNHLVSWLLQNTVWFVDGF